jgi:hypothetical protein
MGEETPNPHKTEEPNDYGEGRTVLFGLGLFNRFEPIG